MNNDRENPWNRLSAGLGAAFVLVLAAAIVVVLLAVFGFVALWAVLAYFVLLAYLRVRRFIRRRFGGAGYESGEGPAGPSPFGNRSEKPFRPENDAGVKTIDVEAEDVVYVDRPETEDRAGHESDTFK